VNIPALVTGLGIGGVAIALAAKESVENFFAAFTILTDKPFQTSDVVRLGTLEGKVERIGFRSTRLRNAEGSLFIIPNKKLIGENLENLTQRDTRRVRVVFHLKYGIAPQELYLMMGELKDMVRQTLHVVEPVNVLLETFGENTFQLSLQYFLPDPLAEGTNPDKIRQEINFKAYSIMSRHTNIVTTDIAEPQPPADIADEPEEQKEDPGLGI